MSVKHLCEGCCFCLSAASAPPCLHPLAMFSSFFWVGKLFITSVKHTCSERTTRAMFSLCIDQQQANQTTCKTANKMPARIRLCLLKMLRHLLVSGDFVWGPVGEGLLHHHRLQNDLLGSHMAAALEPQAPHLWYSPLHLLLPAWLWKLAVSTHCFNTSHCLLLLAWR